MKARVNETADQSADLPNVSQMHYYNIKHSNKRKEINPVYI
jgi:hypothetical protein